MRMKSVDCSVRVSFAPLPFLPIIVSVSLLSKRLLSASSGLSWMLVRLGSSPFSSARTCRYVSPCDMSLPSLFMYPVIRFGDRLSRFTYSSASYTTMQSLRLFSVVHLRRAMTIPRALPAGTSHFRSLSRLSSRERVD